jgi:hypothetical protein
MERMIVSCPSSLYFTLLVYVFKTAIGRLVGGLRSNSSGFKWIRSPEAQLVVLSAEAKRSYAEGSAGTLVGTSVSRVCCG